MLTSWWSWRSLPRLHPSLSQRSCHRLPQPVVIAATAIIRVLWPITWHGRSCRPRNSSNCRTLLHVSFRLLLVLLLYPWETFKKLFRVSPLKPLSTNSIIWCATIEAQAVLYGNYNSEEETSFQRGNLISHTPIWLGKYQFSFDTSKSSQAGAALRRRKFDFWILTCCNRDHHGLQCWCQISTMKPWTFCQVCQSFFSGAFIDFFLHKLRF